MEDEMIDANHDKQICLLGTRMWREAGSPKVEVPSDR
jgi:hypothetical protein